MRKAKTLSSCSQACCCALNSQASLTPFGNFACIDWLCELFLTTHSISLFSCATGLVPQYPEVFCFRYTFWGKRKIFNVGKNCDLIIGYVLQELAFCWDSFRFSPPPDCPGAQLLHAAGPSRASSCDGSAVFAACFATVLVRQSPTPNGRRLCYDRHARQRDRTCTLFSSALPPVAAGLTLLHIPFSI